MRRNLAAFVSVGLLAFVGMAAFGPEDSAPPAKAEPLKKALRVGDAAPKLDIDAWVKGDEVKQFEPGTIYVVEFWATWCPPCRDSIPHLTELQKKHKDQRVVVIGVAGSERKDMANLEKFVKDQGDQMDYRVAFDGDRGTMARYFADSERVGIPHAFIVGDDGKIAWRGNPHPQADGKKMEDKIAGLIAQRNPGKK